MPYYGLSTCVINGERNLDYLISQGTLFVSQQVLRLWIKHLHFKELERWQKSSLRKEEFPDQQADLVQDMEERIESLLQTWKSA